MNVHSEDNHPFNLLATCFDSQLPALLTQYLFLVLVLNQVCILLMRWNNRICILNCAKKECMVLKSSLGTNDFKAETAFKDNFPFSSDVLKRKM